MSWWFVIFPSFVRILKINSPKSSFSSAGGILGDPGAVSGAGEKSKRARKKFGPLAFSSPDFFSRRSRLFPGPTNWPRVSEDGRKEFQLIHFVFLLLFEGTLSTKQHLVSFCFTVFWFSYSSTNVSMEPSYLELAMFSLVKIHRSRFLLANGFNALVFRGHFFQCKSQYL